MVKDWNSAIITDINLVTYVPPHTGKIIHNNRPFHGFVINDTVADKLIHFSDGTVLHTGPSEFHYLPKGTNYRVESLIYGACWAINFDMLEDLNEAPFSIKLRNPESILKNFKEALDAWNHGNLILIRKVLYDLLAKITKEQQRAYIPSRQELLIQPGVDAIHQKFTQNDLSVSSLANLCGISEVYFRRLFVDKFSLTPKEYIIKLKLEHARRLLESSQFTMSEIALMCGYTEPCHFSREFKSAFGISPKEYTKASRN